MDSGTQEPSVRPQAQQTFGQLQPAGFWVRFFASLLDGIILGLILLGLANSAYYINPSWSFANQKFTAILDLTVGFLYTLTFWLKEGATPGKKAFGLRIVKQGYSTEDVNKGLDLFTAFIRYIGYFLSSVVFMLGFIWVGLDKEKRGWHDKIAGTAVVRLDDKKRLKLKILVLLLGFVFITLWGVWVTFVTVKDELGTDGINKIMKRYIEEDGTKNQNPPMDSKAQENALLAELDPQVRSIVEESKDLIYEAQKTIGGANCDIQLLDKELESKLKKAVEKASKAVDLDSKNAYTHYNLAYAYNWAACFPFGGSDKAMFEYKKAIELKEDFISAHRGLGVMYVNLKNYSAAIPHLEYTTQKLPFCGICWLELGEAYLSYGAKTKAENALKMASQLIPENGTDRIRLEKLLDSLSNK